MFEKMVSIDSVFSISSNVLLQVTLPWNTILKRFQRPWNWLDITCVWVLYKQFSLKCSHSNQNWDLTAFFYIKERGRPYQPPRLPLLNQFFYLTHLMSY